MVFFLRWDIFILFNNQDRIYNDIGGLRDGFGFRFPIIFYIFAVHIGSDMYVKTDAVVLHLQKHNDRTCILHAYTQTGGRMQYIVHISRKGSMPASLQPLSIVEIEASANNRATQLQHIKSVRLLYVPCQNDFNRLSVNIFIAEVLYKILRHPMADSQLFDFIVGAIQKNDRQQSVANSHLQFLVHLTTYLGITPSIDSDDDWLDMRTGLTSLQRPVHPDFFTKDEMRAINALSCSTDIVLSRTERQVLIEKLCRYYELHITDFHTPKSLDILKELFD